MVPTVYMGERTWTVFAILILAVSGVSVAGALSPQRAYPRSLCRTPQQRLTCWSTSTTRRCGHRSCW